MFDIDKHLTDHQLLTYFNPHYHQHIIDELQEDKNDLYHKSSGMTDYDGIYGIQRVSIPVESLGIKLCAVDDHINTLQQKFRRRQKSLNDFKSELTDAERTIIDEYFHEQFHNHHIISHPVIALMREVLYTEELDQRKQRQLEQSKAAMLMRIKRAPVPNELALSNIIN